MKLYRAKVPVIAQEAIQRLLDGEDIEVLNREEAEADLVAIMEEYLRRDQELRSQARDYMSRRNLPYDQYGRIHKRMAEAAGHPLGDAIERYLTQQVIENLLISPSIDEVYAEDKDLHRRVIEVFRAHDVDEQAIREEAQTRIRNVKEGTVDYELALRSAIKQVKKRKGLL